MLRKTSRQSGKKLSTFHLSKRVQFLTLALLALTALLSLGTFAGPSSGGLHALLGASPNAPSMPMPPPSNPSKEYIYAGGKLVATEEPNVAGSLTTPTGLIAATLSGSQIDITWSAASGADHYEVERRPNIDAPWTAVSTNVVTPNYSDTTVSSINAYLYRVRAVDLVGNVSSYSNVDVSTAITFTDDPLVVNSTVIKSDHIMQLRQAVTAVRATAKLLPFSWTDNLASLSGIKVKTQHLEELRTALDDALTVLGLPLSSYSDSGPTGLTGVPIKKVHIDELRQRVK
jgi:hypothetical protein